MPPQQTNDDIYFHPCKDRMPILHKRVTYVTFSLIQIFQQFFFLSLSKKLQVISKRKQFLRKKKLIRKNAAIKIPS